MSLKPPSDAALIKQHLNGSATALMRLWVRYDGLVYGLAQSVLCRSDVADDVRQDVFLIVSREVANLKTPERFASWLKTVTLNACRTWFRRQRATVPLDELAEHEHPSAPPDTSLEDEETRTALRRMIDRLPSEYREVVELRYFEDAPIARIAAFLDIPQTTVKWRLHKARERLRNGVVAIVEER